MYGKSIFRAFPTNHYSCSKTKISLSEGRDLFRSYEQWENQIFENLPFRPHLAPLKEPNGLKWGQILFPPNHHHIDNECTLLKVMNNEKVNFSKICLQDVI